MIRVTKRVPAEELETLLSDCDRGAIVTDSNVAPLLKDTGVPDMPVITIPAGEESKNIATCTGVWREMSELGLTRHSVIVNVGGGVVTDLGGFCAATYMRGIPFINVSTTLLGAVDASVGGKTGVDLDGLKNRIGVFAQPRATFVPVEALATLPAQDMLSGYAEMIKTAYIFSPEFTDEMLRYSPLSLDVEATEKGIKRCLEVKSGVVARDPQEKGERKILNFGHTAGHAFEEFAMQRKPMLHGIAVAHGMLVALVLSHLMCGLPSAEIYRYADRLREVFPPMRITCNDYDELLRLMRLDKKNRGGCDTRFVLLRAIGECVTDVAVPEKEIKNALDIYSDLTGQ